MQFQSISDNDLGKGIDSRSSENTIPEGYSADLLNLVTINKRLAKRRGFELYGGCFPLRVARVDYTASNDQIRFSFDGAVNLATQRAIPVVVYGRTNLNSHGGDFTLTDTGQYYSSITPNTRETLLAGSNTITKTTAERPIADDIFITGLAEATSLNKTDNTVFAPDAVQQNQTTQVLDIDYTVAENKEAFVYYKAKTASPGSIYVDDSLAIDGSGNGSVTAATHGLDNFNITAYFFRDTGTEWQEVWADDVAVDGSGTVSVSFDGLASTTVRVILTAIPPTQVVSESISAGATQTITISGNSSPYMFAQIFSSGSLVFIDSIVYDEDTDTHTLTIVNGGSPNTFEVRYEFGAIAANSFTITSGTAITSDGVDTSPQMTVWGFCHENSTYGGSKTLREGWVTHLDSYRRLAEERMIASQSGVIYRHANRTELDSAYKLDFKYPYLRARKSTADGTVGPGFQPVAGTFRTLGSVQTADCDTSGRLPITTIAYNSGTGYVDFTLSATSKTVYADGGGVSTTTIDNVILTDLHYITFSNCNNSRFNGTHLVKAVAETADTITISVSLSTVTTSIWDETDVGGLAGLFTDALVVTTTDTEFLAGDTITDGTNSWTVSTNDTSANSDNRIFLSSTTSFITVAGDQRLTGTRNASIIQVRDGSNSLNTDNVVPGDALSITGEDGTYQVTYVNTSATEAVTLTDNGTSLTISGVTSTAAFALGQKVVLAAAGATYSGEHVITGIPTTTSLTVASVSSGSGSANLLGKTIEVDKALSWTDNRNNLNIIDIAARWIPVEAPDNAGDLTPSTYTYYLNAGTVSNKPFVRSSVVNSSMYFTTGDDEVYKFDGTNAYKAGVFRWQPQAFISKDNSGGTIPYAGAQTGTIGTINGNVFNVSDADAQLFSVGNRIEHSDDNARYTITKIDTNETDSSGTITVDKPISGSASTGALDKIQAYSYYYRLNLIDVNNNVVASAVTGSQDYRVEIDESVAIKHRLIGFPVIGNYDYDRVELEIYRTQSDDAVEYRRITTIPVNFDNSEGYVDFIDTLSDEDWTRQPLDLVSSALLGAELGTTWGSPQRSKYITSTSNRLILGNIKSYPRLDISVIPEVDEVAETDLTGLIWEFKRTNNTASGTTNMTTNVSYEFVTTSGAVTPSSFVNNAGASFTVNATAHGLAAGDWVYLYHSAVASTHSNEYAGWWQINSVNVNDFTIVHSHDSGYTPGAADVDRYVTATAQEDVPVLIDTDGSRDYISGNTAVPRFDAVSRLAQAMNASMRKVDTTISGYADFEGWLVANAGGEFAAGQLIVEQPFVDTELATGEAFELVLPSFSNMLVFVNNINRAAAAEVQAVELSFPSRLLVSYPNYPELFDAPLATLPADSDAVVDVNSADGQEITGMIPFFGDSAFGAAQKSGVLVVFKANSIYLVDTETKQQGAGSGVANPVQRLESRGLGCTAPDSIAQTRNGIIFANESGMYALTRQLEIVYIGRPMSRNWERVNKEQLALCKGHHYAQDSQYKLSVPIGSSSIATSEVYVFDHADSEGALDGSWTRFDGHDATWWANLGDDAFFAATNGKVKRIRNNGTATDFRDENAAISATATMRANDFGVNSVRKLISKLFVHLRNEFPSEGTQVSWARDLSSTFETLAVPDIDTGDGSVVTIRYDLKRARAVYLQIKITNGTVDEPLDIAALSYRVGALSAQGTSEAGDI